MSKRPIGKAKRACIVLATTSIVLLARDAHADVEIEASLSSGVAWTRVLPPLRVDPVTTSARDIGRGELQHRGGMTMLGGGGDVGLAVRSRWAVPLFGLRVYGALGTYDRTVASLDGSIAYIRPWTGVRLDVLLPGFGYRVTHRRYMVSAGIRPGFALLALSGSVAAGAESTDLDLQAGTFVLQADLDVCRRLDPNRRVCVQVAPRIYEFGFLNGGTIALRIEWGGRVRAATE